MPDGWEATYGFDPALNDAHADADGEGLSNLQEFLAGTNPQDAADALLLQPLTTFSSGTYFGIVLGFSPRSNKTYTIIFRDVAEGTGWTNLLNVGFAPTNRFISFIDWVPTNASTRFYQLGTPKHP
jgi:hypothetical protein